MFRVGLVIFQSVLGKSDQLKACAGLYETMEVIRHIPHEYLEEEYLVKEVRITLKTGMCSIILL